MVCGKEFRAERGVVDVLFASLGGESSMSEVSRRLVSRA